MKSDFLLALNQICSERKLPREVVLEALEMALASAYRREHSISAGRNITAKLDLETGKSYIFVEKRVVETVTNHKEEIALKDAQTIDPDIAIGDNLLIEDTPDNFGRIAAQSAKQIILQRIREAEREARYSQYIQQEGEIVHGTVQSIKPQAVILHLEGTEAILPRNQQTPGERYTIHQRLRAYVLEVRRTSRGPQIVVSRNHSNMLKRLLELEVPEIFSGAVEIKAIAREAGSRSKVAVAARQPGVDPVGACVGMRGVRIQSIVNELGGEKIDVIEWSPDTSIFISKALSPAKVLSIHLEEGPSNGRTANVVVMDDQLSLAIGRAGQNARLAAKLTGWRIDIQGVTEAASWALRKINEDPDVLPGIGPVAELLPTVANILRQHEQVKLPYSGEELLLVRQVIESVQQYYSSVRNSERQRLIKEEALRRARIEAAQSAREAEIQAAIAKIPARAYEIPLSEIGLSVRVLTHLERAGLKNVGQVMALLAEGDEGLLQLHAIGPKSLKEIKRCLQALALPAEETQEELSEKAQEQLPAAEALEPSPSILETAETETTEVTESEEAESTPPTVELVAESPSVEAEGEEKIETISEEAPPAEALEPEEVPPAETLEPEEAQEVEEEQEAISSTLPPFIEGEEEEEFSIEETRKRDRRRRRQLIYDEEAGVVIARRHRKRGDFFDELDDLDEWEEFIH